MNSDAADGWNRNSGFSEERRAWSRLVPAATHAVSAGRCNDLPQRGASAIGGMARFACHMNMAEESQIPYLGEAPGFADKLRIKYALIGWHSSR